MRQFTFTVSLWKDEMEVARDSTYVGYTGK